MILIKNFILVNIVLKNHFFFLNFISEADDFTQIITFLRIYFFEFKFFVLWIPRLVLYPLKLLWIFGLLSFYFDFYFYFYFDLIFLFLFILLFPFLLFSDIFDTDCALGWCFFQWLSLVDFYFNYWDLWWCTAL